MKKPLLFLLASLTLFIGFQGCNKSPTGSESEDTDEIKISENTVILADSTVNKISQESGDSVIYFNKDAQEILQLENDDIIVSSDGEGFLRKVKETKEEASYIIVKTEYAALEDAIEKGNLAISNKTLNFDEMRTTSKLRGVRFKSRGDLLEVDFDSLIHEDPTTGAEIRGVGRSVFGAVIDTLGAEFLFGLQSFKFGLKVYHSESLGVGITKGCSFEGKVKLASFVLTPILVHVGIPIVITPHVDLYIGANLNVQASVSTSVQKNDTIIGGITYSKAQGWSTFSDYKKSFSYSPPSVSLSGEAEIYAVVPEISFQIYELAGPYAQMKGYSRIEVNPQATPWWILYGGFEVEGGVEMEILAWNVTWSGLIYSNEWELASASGGANTPPNTPSTPSGQNEGIINTEYTFTTSTTDPDGDNVAYQFDWGNGNISAWSSYVSSGSSVEISHSWSSAGTYSVKAKAKDKNGAESGWSSGHSIVISSVANSAPNTPSTPSGPSTGEVGTSYSFSTSTTDPDGDNVSYKFDWGDGDISSWSSYVPSGTPANMSHSWSSAGTYSVKAKAKDEDGAESEWSNGHSIAIIESGGSPGTQKWTFLTGSNVESSPAIGSDGTIYVGSDDNNLYAINPDGSQKWAFPTGGGIHSSPAIGTDGTIYVGSRDNNLYAINPDGSQKWAFPTGDYDAWVEPSPAIGNDGTIYVGSWNYGNFYAINPDGSQKWAFPTGDVLQSSPAIGADGTIYVDFGNSLYAINPDESQKWAFSIGEDERTSSPTIGSDGTIYVGSDDNNLYAINPNGTQKWTFLTGSNVESSPAIGADGTIYVGSSDGNLYAINPDGSQKWASPTGGGLSSSPAIGSDGTIYVGSFDNNLYAINPDGTQKWAFLTGSYVMYSSPVIGSDGTIYVGSWDNNLYAIYGSSGGLANTTWPMFHHDERHSGRVGGP